MSELLIAISLVTVVFVRMMLFQFATLGAIYFPLVLAAFGFASLLYNRSRAYTRGRGRVRSLYAAERATQGVFFLLLAGVLAGGLYTVFVYLGFEPVYLMADLRPKHAWLLLFLAPMFMAIPGVVCLRLAIEIAAADFLGHRGPRELRRRIREGLGE
ncbi:hypothetical protein J2W24_005494 [Variovorax boronicumulans]|uniref:hypothetical protein n=1 Tax=Variovorax boronicumulans TaxID=436515 RepID=UPI00278064B4|nr:hypothetical protein [Variovorax boronicumulans]MDP9919814.1 hypothetical protein [Variovorax boronicumulans]